MVYSNQTQDIIQKICRLICDFDDVNSLYMFGSRVRGSDRIESDVDLVIDLCKKADLTVHERFRLIDRSLEIAEKLKDEIDLDIDILELHELETMKKSGDLRRRRRSKELATEIESSIVKIYE